MEVKIAVQFAARELVLESEQSAEDVEKAVEAAVASGGLLKLTDDKGRRVVVPVDKLAYVEIEQSTTKNVGFGSK